MKCAPFQSPSARKPRRLFWMLNRSSEILPPTVLLYGTLPKLLPIWEFAALSRQTNVASTKPTGAMQTLPSRKYGGTALVSGPASQGLPGVVVFCPPFNAGDTPDETAGEIDGMIGVVLATSP